MLGLKRGKVELMEHQESWRTDALDAITSIKAVLGDAAIDVQHVGSTAINGIRAKPIIDIAVSVKTLDDVKPYIDALKQVGIVYRKQDVEGQLLFVMGDFGNDFRTHHIHVVVWASIQWCNYINFRDYLNAFGEKAKAYDALKLSLAEQFPQDRESYTNGKKEQIMQLLKEAHIWRENCKDPEKQTCQYR